MAAATADRTVDRVVLVHGFTQTARSWRPMVTRLTAALGPNVDVVALDAPGHGERSDVRADLPTGAELLGAEGGRATYVGYSMGGRFCLHLALQRPDLVDRLVLIGATPGIENAAERAARRTSDEALADEIEGDGLEAFLERWLAQPLFASLGRAEADVESRRANTVAGLASSLRLAGTGTQVPLWDRLGELSMPVLVISGEDDVKFTAIGRRMAASIPDATLVVVEGAGHAVHLTRPAHTCEAIVAWWRRGHTPSASPTANAAP